MNIDVLRYLIEFDYQNLKEVSKDKDNHIDIFYYQFAKYFLGEDNILLSYLEDTSFNEEEVCIIYDVLDSKSDTILKIAKEKLKQKYQNYLNLDNAYKDSDLEEIINNINLPKKDDKRINLRKFSGISILIIGFISLIITTLLSFKLNEDIKYFSTVLLISIPLLLIVIGINLIIFKKNNYLLITLEAFILIYIASFILLIPYQDNKNIFVNLKNHFYEVIKSLYNYFSYITFKDLEGLS